MRPLRLFYKVNIFIAFLFFNLFIVNARELFLSEKPHFEAKFEHHYNQILTNFRSLRFLAKDHQLLHQNIDQSIKEKNPHYINTFNQLLAEYYNHQENYKLLIELYDETINNPVYEHSISYVLLLNRFYHFFYLHNINNECDRILEKIRSIIPHLDDKEAIYVESIADYLVGLRVKGNTIDVKQKNITRSIENIENVQRFFSEIDFSLMLAHRYNHLAISYVNIDNNHAIMMFKKALRYTGNDDLRLRIAILSNINYLHNLTDQADKGLIYGLEGEKLCLNHNFKTNIYNKIICNLSDSYRLMGNEEKMLEYKKICDNEILVFQSKGEQLTENIKKYLNSNERKVNKTFFGRNMYYIIGGTIGIIFILVIIPLLRTQKTKITSG